LKNNKIGGEYISVKAVVICKTDPTSLFSCKIDIKIGAIHRDILKVYMHVHTQAYIKKAVPLKTWSGPEGSRKLSFLDFITMAHDGVWVASLTHRPPLPPGNTPGTHFC
jgi:hypothetical protein